MCMRPYVVFIEVYCSSYKPFVVDAALSKAVHSANALGTLPKVLSWDFSKILKTDIFKSTLIMGPQTDPTKPTDQSDTYIR